MALWDKITSRGDVEDRRSNAPVAIGGLTLTGLALYFAFNLLAGSSPRDILNTLINSEVQNQQTQQSQTINANDTYQKFASTVLGSANDMWTVQFQKIHKTYTPPKLVLFRQSTESACGGASSDVGPHYCPEDKTIYLDETFFDELELQFGATKSDVGEAYVIAHEVGHHAQNELGFLEKELSVSGNNASGQDKASIQTELQADCFAGMWANSLKDKGVFEQGEIKEAIDEAAAVGDDRIQKKVTGYINPETWTHGSSVERVTSFTKGYDSGNLSSCMN